MGEASDWKTRDAYLLSILEVVGSYFVDVFYNGLYAEARSSRGAAAGLGDEYVRVVSSYAAGLQDPVCYNNMVRGLHQRFTDSTQLGDLGLAGVVDRVAGVLAPEGDFSRLRAEDRDYLLSTLLGGAVAALAAHAISPAGIRLVVTDRAPVAVRKLQDDAMRILLHQRDKIYATFLSAEDKRPPPKLVDEMRTTLRKLAQEKAAALKAAEDERKRADGLAAQLAAAVAAEAKARAAASDLNSRARHYLGVITGLQRTVDELRRAATPVGRGGGPPASPGPAGSPVPRPGGQPPRTAPGPPLAVGPAPRAGALAGLRAPDGPEWPDWPRQPGPPPHSWPYVNANPGPGSFDEEARKTAPGGAPPGLMALLSGPYDAEDGDGAAGDGAGGAA